jgi:hypothetical protein
VWEEHTFAVYPYEGAIRLPFDEDTAFEEPLGCSGMVNVARDVVIGRGIWRSNPASEILLQLVPCER